jgi:4-hydroxy-3-methylbut-2-en-1-yl diphosphate reductase
MVETAKEKQLDFILVIGGWDSSNTAHLLEIPVHAGIRSFHINRAECISADNTITHRTVDGEIVTEPFILDMSKDVMSQIFLLKKVYNSQEQQVA